MYVFSTYAASYAFHWMVDFHTCLHQELVFLHNTLPMHLCRSLDLITPCEISLVLQIAYKNDCPTPDKVNSRPACRLQALQYRTNVRGTTMAQNPNATAQAMAAAAEALLQGPGLQPPPGVFPNLIDPPSQAHWVYVTLPICLAVSTPFVWIRLCTAFFILKSHGWADCMYTSKMAD